ncbi:MAG: hypothetical protein V7K48_02420 [Nostoc sp.]
MLGMFKLTLSVRIASVCDTLRERREAVGAASRREGSTDIF